VLCLLIFYCVDVQDEFDLPIKVIFGNLGKVFFVDNLAYRYVLQ